MATTFYLTDIPSTALDPQTLETRRKLQLGVKGTGVVATDAVATANGAFLKTYSSGGGSSFRLSFISNPLNAVTIAGSITMNFWASEDNAKANCGAAAYIYTGFSTVVPRTTDILGSFQTPASAFAKGVEYGTTRAVQNFSAAPASPVAVNRGDRIYVQLQFVDAGGTMASGFTSTASYAGITNGLDGDSFVTFTEAITEQAPIPPVETNFVYLRKNR